MAWKTTLIVLFLVGCAHPIRGVAVCKPNIKNQKVTCAEGNKSYKKPISYIDGYFCSNETSVRKLADKLQSCEESK